MTLQLGDFIPKRVLFSCIMRFAVSSKGLYAEKHHEFETQVAFLRKALKNYRHLYIFQL